MQKPVLTIERDGDKLSVSGELDRAVGANLEQAIAEFGDGPCELDLRGLEFLDSAGLHCLLRIKHAHPGVCIPQASVPKPALRVIDILGLRARLLG